MEQRGNELARRVVEQPRRNPLPYFVVAAIASVIAWTLQQPSSFEPLRQSESRQAATRAEDRSGAHPAKGDLRTLFSADDYPEAAANAGEQGTVQARLAVDSSGRVAGCAIVRSSGSPTLDGATCSILQRRAHFIPARDVNGYAVADSVITPPIVWRLEG